MSKIYNEAKVAILMATYNGEKYLSEQIESIRRQTFADWTLYIQDDGSSDGTVCIIRDFCSVDPRIKLFDIGLTRQGAGMNFMSMLNAVDSEYYMFSDQDDVWFEDKVERTLRRMKEEEAAHPGKPVIVHTSRTFTDEKLNVKLVSEFNPRNKPDAVVERKIELMKDPNILRIYTIAGGCTMMLNRLAKEAAFPYISLRVHDSVCAMAVANKGGVISTIISPTMYYRLHSSQTCGVRSNNLLPKFMHIFKTLASNMRGYHIWKVYGGGNFFKFLYWRFRYFFILRRY